MPSLKITALAGGVGGAKLADGLAQVLQPDHLTVIVNTADDFTHLGLRISPDVDTVCYTLAGLSNPETGWGRIHETWNVLVSLQQLGMPDWFQLGDLDLGVHIARTSRLNTGWKLSQVIEDFCRSWGVVVKVLPMSDDTVQTVLYTDQGELGFQEYFVHQKCQPVVKKFRFEGAGDAVPAPGVLEAINQADAVVFCPSNPWVSIDPIISIPGIESSLKDQRVIAISPIIGRQAVKGPAAKMFIEMGIPPSATAVARHYGNLIDSFILDQADSQEVADIHALGIQAFSADILMRDRTDRARLAGEIIDYITGSGR